MSVKEGGRKGGKGERERERERKRERERERKREKGEGCSVACLRWLTAGGIHSHWLWTHR